MFEGAATMTLPNLGPGTSFSCQSLEPRGRTLNFNRVELRASWHGDKQGRILPAPFDAESPYAAETALELWASRDSASATEHWLYKKIACSRDMHIVSYKIKAK